MDQRMDRARRRAREAIWPIRIGVLLGFGISLLEVVQFATIGGSSRELAAFLCSVAAGTLVWLSTVQLAKENKRALTFLLAGLGLGFIRSFAIDQTLSVTIPTILLFALFVWFAAQFVYWIRIGVLK